MNLNKILLLILSAAFLYSCAEYNINNSNSKKEKLYYSSSGFALIYEDILYLDKTVNQRINNDDLIIMHSKLKRNTPIMITNPFNSKTIKTKIYKKADYPVLFNALISKKIATDLELDVNNPYIEILEIKKNRTFVAKEGDMFDEEKNVAVKAPVNEVKMDVLSDDKNNNIKKIEKKKTFILVVSDFYYLDSANNLKNELSKKTNINNFEVKKINITKYRLLVGPFKNFNALKSAYISLNNLGFDSMNIYID